MSCSARTQAKTTLCFQLRQAQVCQLRQLRATEAAWVNTSRVPLLQVTLNVWLSSRSMLCLCCSFLFVLLLQPLSELTPSDSERLITVSGGRDKVLRAVALILNTVSTGHSHFSVSAVCAGGGVGCLTARKGGTCLHVW